MSRFQDLLLKGLAKAEQLGLFGHVGGGEGSRGGHVIGHTKTTGKPIYESAESSRKSDEHEAKAKHHYTEAAKHKVGDDKRFAHLVAAGEHTKAATFHHADIAMPKEFNSAAVQHAMSGSNKQSEVAEAASKKANKLTHPPESGPGSRNWHDQKAAEHRKAADKHRDRMVEGGATKYMDAHKKAKEAHDFAAEEHHSHYMRGGTLAGPEKGPGGEWEGKREKSERLSLAAHDATSAAEGTGSAADGHARAMHDHLDSAEKHRVRADLLRADSAKLRSKNPDSPKGKKLLDIAYSHGDVAAAHSMASGKHGEAVSAHSSAAWGDKNVTGAHANKARERAYVASSKANEMSAAAEKASAALAPKEKGAKKAMGTPDLTKGLFGGRGEGSRGGHIVGHSSNGDPIYEKKQNPVIKHAPGSKDYHQQMADVHDGQAKYHRGKEGDDHEAAKNAHLRAREAHQKAADGSGDHRDAKEATVAAGKASGKTAAVGKQPTGEVIKWTKALDGLPFGLRKADPGMDLQAHNAGRTFLGATGVTVPSDYLDEIYEVPDEPGNGGLDAAAVESMYDEPEQIVRETPIATGGAYGTRY
jgi:hypothetical protein